MTRRSDAGLTIVLVLMLACSVSALRAQSPTVGPTYRPQPMAKAHADYIPRQRFVEAMKRASVTNAMGSPVLVAKDDQTAYLVIHRSEPSAVEEHSRWDDIIVVQSGRATLLLGRGKTRGATLRAPGELRGGTLTDPLRVPLSIGDVARVPAGVAHALEPVGVDTLRAILIKVRRPSKPLRTSAR
ncbi:MAG: cupin domain-containing protein [Gemmatimonadaceae bacterium]|nr:cupin domain-containing protein [Gemmatimonadaceae bacterium]